MTRRVLPIVLLLISAVAADAAMSKSEAKKLLAENGLPETADGILAVLNTSWEMAPKIVEAYLALGVPANKAITYDTSDGVKLTRYPLNYLLMFACDASTTVTMTKLLVDAGADPNTTDPENDWSALSQAHRCPDVIRVLLNAPKKPDIHRVDRNGNTAMHLVVTFGERQEESIKLLRDAGFNVDRWRDDLYERARQNPPVLAALGLKPRAPSSAPQVTSSRTTTSRLDWKALPPYPDRSAAEVTKLLSRPGAVTAIDDHMWDGITQREPQRLFMALQAGADVHRTRAITGYTPLVLLAERCDEDEDGEIQTANVEMLIAAGADLAGVDANGENALMLAAGNCPLGVVRALLGAGISPHARTSKGATALRNAITDGRADVVEELLNAGVDPKKEPYNARALASGNVEIEAILKKRRK
jgi:ankyrin repeat protein